jgi:hypothetical protein
LSLFIIITIIIIIIGHFFSFLILYIVGRIPLAGDQLVARPLSTQGTTWYTHTDIHPSSGIGNQDPIMEETACLGAGDAICCY